MFVGETGVRRIVARTAELMKTSPGGDVRAAGGIDLPTLQKYVNFWYSISLDLFGGEISSNAAEFFAAGLKGRAQERRHEDHVALEGAYRMTVPEGGALVDRDVPLRNAMNEVLRDAYVEDNQRGVDMWNRTLAEAGLEARLTLPSRRFNRQVGAFAQWPCTPEGVAVSADEWARRRDEWLPSEADRAFIAGLMKPVHERGRIAGWIAPPLKGINGQAFDFEYVRD